MSRSMGIPVKPLHETARPVVRVELTSGLLYRGNMIECEDIWNCRLGNIICAAKETMVTTNEQTLWLNVSQVVAFHNLQRILRKTILLRQTGEGTQ
ncbi:hypothetical protein OPV22_007999 [Ensete ventricosum]|uniref:LSM domain-containing protein n=1 Tax=Ensete ventricosum TaxID=4639 RepID=A0AAV8RFZ4_ENSVE|nr:hypothetical protein OPV22_007999 [Ensete ventricosum]